MIRSEYADRACPECDKYMMQRIRESHVVRERVVWFIPFWTRVRAAEHVISDVCFSCGHEAGVIRVFV